MTHSMHGKTVLITGGTGGIGRAAAIGLASMGARVGITGRDRTRAEQAAAAIARESGNPAVDVFVADMSSQTEVRRLAGEVLSAYPRLDVLLNNVGGFWAHRHVTADPEQTPMRPPRLFVRSAWVVHRAIYRLTGGRRGLWRPKAGSKESA